MIRGIVLVFAFAACNSKPPPPATAPANHEMAPMPPELAKFHDVLAPRWHADKDRMKDTCAALPEFHAAADVLAKATPPEATHADTWTTGTKQLIDAVGGLDSICRANDANAFEGAFAKVHQSFHFLLAQQGDPHE